MITLSAWLHLVIILDQELQISLQYIVHFFRSLTLSYKSNNWIIANVFPLDKIFGVFIHEKKLFRKILSFCSSWLFRRRCSKSAFLFPLFSLLLFEVFRRIFSKPKETFLLRVSSGMKPWLQRAKKCFFLYHGKQ